MERDHVLLAFKGSITSDLLTSVLQIMESKMDDLNDAPKTKRRVFNVLVECLPENIPSRKQTAFEEFPNQETSSTVPKILDHIRPRIWKCVQAFPPTSFSCLSPVLVPALLQLSVLQRGLRHSLPPLTAFDHTFCLLGPDNSDHIMGFFPLGRS